jgi:hypothetical protein
VTSEAGLPWEAPAPAEHGRQWIKIELDRRVNPWEHEGAGSITWGANLDRLAPLGEDAVSIIKKAWEYRRQPTGTKREHEESQPVERVPDASASIKPGWASRVGVNQYWIRLTLYQPIIERWEEEAGENWSCGGLINDGIVDRGATVEATTHLGRKALRIIEALHSTHPFNEIEPPEDDAWYDS